MKPRKKSGKIRNPGKNPESGRNPGFLAVNIYNAPVFAAKCRRRNLLKFLPGYQLSVTYVLFVKSRQKNVSKKS